MLLRRAHWLLICLFATGCPSQETTAGGASPGPNQAKPKTESKPAGQAEQTGGEDKDAKSAFEERKQERERLIKLAVEQEGIDDERVLKAMRRVPRHRFVPEAYRDDAYRNRPLPIGHGQTISQPYIVAAMTAAADPNPDDKCLEIGTGSGYQAAVLAEVCKKVYSIEYLPKVAAFGKSNLREVGYGPEKVKLRVGDGYQGWPKVAPFDVILVTAAPEDVPQPLLDQLAVGGRLLIPVGPEHGVQRLERWVRVAPGEGEDKFKRETLMGVRFVPFLGDGGTER